MPDGLQNFLRMLQARLRVIAFVVAAAMLGAIVYLKAADTGPKLTPLPETPPPVKIEHKQDAADGIAQELSRSDVPIEKSALRNLIADDMFSSKAILVNIQNERRAKDKITEAERAKAAGNPQEALRLVQEALLIFPHYLDAIRMQKQLETQLGIKPQSATADTTTTAAVAPAPAKAAPAPAGAPAAAPAPAPAAAAAAPAR